MKSSLCVLLSPGRICTSSQLDGTGHAGSKVACRIILFIGSSSLNSLFRASGALLFDSCGHVSRWTTSDLQFHC